MDDDNYKPYVDDRMEQAIAGTNYKVADKNKEYDSSKARYVDALRKNIKPFYETYGLPLGSGMKQDIRANYLAKYGKPIKPARLYGKLYRNLKGLGMTSAQLNKIKTKRNMAVLNLNPHKQNKYILKDKARKAKMYSTGDGLTRTGKLLYKKYVLDERNPRETAYYNKELEFRRADYKKQMAKLKAGPVEKYERYKAMKREANARYRTKATSNLNTLAKMRASKMKKPKRYMEGEEKYKREREDEAIALAQEESMIPDIPPKLPPRGTGLAEKLYKYKYKAKMGDPVAAAKYQQALAAIDGGLLTARGISARGGPYTMRVSGGAIGLAALASAAAPLLLEGVKWIGKKIGDRRAKKKAQQDISGGAVRSDGFWIGDADGTAPKSAKNFWWLVYRMATRQIPIYFSPDNLEIIEPYIESFMVNHANKFFGTSSKKINKARDSASAYQTSLKTVAKPIVKKAAKKARVPKTAVKEVLGLPGMESPAGSGIFDSLLSILKNPAVKGLLSEGAKRLAPVVTKKITDFAKSKLLKSPKARKVFNAAAPYAQDMLSGLSSNPVLEKNPEVRSTTTVPDIVSVPTEGEGVMTKAPLMARGGAVCGSSADAYKRGGRIATRVYTMAKKT